MDIFDWLSDAVETVTDTIDDFLHELVTGGPDVDPVTPAVDSGHPLPAHRSGSEVLFGSGCDCGFNPLTCGAGGNFCRWQR